MNREPLWKAARAALFCVVAVVVCSILVVVLE